MGLRKTIMGHEEPGCLHPNAGKFCPDCGRLIQVPRYSWSEMSGAQGDVLFEKGFRRTLMGLFLHPGPSIRTFLFQDRNHLVKPTAYLLLALAFSLWAERYTQTAVACAADDTICQLIDQSATQIQAMLIGVLALVYRLAFRKVGLSLWEYVAGFCYIVAQSSILGGLLSLLFYVLGLGGGETISFFGSFVYLIFATVQFLQIRGGWRIAGAVLLGLLAMALFLVVVFTAGFAFLLADGLASN